MPGGPISGPSSGTVAIAGPVYPQKYYQPPQLQPPFTGSSAGGQGEGQWTVFNVLAIYSDPIVNYFYSGEDFPQQATTLPSDDYWLQQFAQAPTTYVLITTEEEAPAGFLTPLHGQPEEEFWLTQYLPSVVQPLLQPFISDDDQFTTRIYEDEFWSTLLQAIPSSYPVIQQFQYNDELPVQAVAAIIEEESWLTLLQAVPFGYPILQQFQCSDELPVQAAAAIIEDALWFNLPVSTPAYQGLYWFESDGNIVFVRAKFVPWIAEDDA